MTCTIVVGGQWGDEAKGKICSYLALKDCVDVSCRAGLGPGAGHTVVHDGVSYKLRQIPSAFVNPRSRLLIGPGTLIREDILLREISELGVETRIGIDPRATVIEASHIYNDVTDPYLASTIESTGSGHGPCLAARALRKAELAETLESLKPFLCDVPVVLNEALDAGQRVLVEGTNGFGLSVLFGTYPYVVGKDSTASTAAADVGLGPRRVDDVILVFKTFPTRVGKGPFPTELDPEEAERLHIHEVGTVTGRPRRIGHFDFDAAAAASRVNAPSQLAVTFLDRVDPNCKGCSWHTLSHEACVLVAQIERACGVPATLLGTGPETMDIIDRRSDA